MTSLFLIGLSTSALATCSGCLSVDSSVTQHKSVKHTDHGHCQHHQEEKQTESHDDAEKQSHTDCACKCCFSQPIFQTFFSYIHFQTAISNQPFFWSSNYYGQFTYQLFRPPIS